VVRAWAWLCAHTDDLDEKQRCLTAIFDLDPEPEWAQLALRLALQQQGWTIAQASMQSRK
jgi:hypothetical protein